jgi:hypothetical protein
MTMKTGDSGEEWKVLWKDRELQQPMARLISIGLVKS